MTTGAAQKKGRLRTKKKASFFVVPMNSRGTLTLPKELRELVGLDEACQVFINVGKDGIQIRPSATYPVEIYSEDRIKHFLENTEGVLKNFGFK